MLFVPAARQALLTGFAASVLMVAVHINPAAAGETSDACDAAAAARFDTDRPASVTPVALAKIDGTKAQAACEASVAATPTDRRQVYELGRVYLAAKNYPKALESFKRASDLGSAIATSDLASMIEAGLGTAKDPAAARALAEKAATAGNPQAQFNLAVMYEIGAGGMKDLTKARALLDKAAKAGVPKAAARLGYQQELGIGGPADPTSARISYIACMNEPEPGAYQSLCQRRLGFLQATGKLGKPDFTAARILFEKSSANGDIVSLRALGQLYEMGKGVPVDFAKARDFYEKAAAKGDAGAMRQLAIMYEKGLGVPRDGAKARSWTEQSKTAIETEKALKDIERAD
jgi:TPR repeat protein